MQLKRPGLHAASVQRVCDGSSSPEPDLLAVEEPLEIRLGYTQNGRRAYMPLSVTMRTPGHDKELAAGFLLTEGIISSATQIERLRHCGGSAAHCSKNTIIAELHPDVIVDLDRLKRHLYTSSSCGVCGKTSISAVRVGLRCRLLPGPFLAWDVVNRLPTKLRASQSIFDSTGGLHASALFDERGNMLSLYEDVGRHNALDKLIGAELLAGRWPLSNRLLLVSGRVSFELVQKAAAAGIPILAAVGAPSSLAVDLARNCGMTLLGFVRDNRFNIYSGADRIRADARPPSLARTADVQSTPISIAQR